MKTNLHGVSIYVSSIPGEQICIRVKLIDGNGRFVPAEDVVIAAGGEFDKTIFVGSVWPPEQVGA